MKFVRNIIVVFVLLTFFISFVPKTYADDPCDPIANAPLLYQINRTPTQATLFFTPITNDQVQNYTIIYGFRAEDERYSITVNQGVSTGAISYTLNDLEPGVQYFYKVKGNTSCTSSPWSSWEGDQAVTSGSSTSVPGIPVAGPPTMYLWGAGSFFMILSGAGLFAFSRRKA